MSLSGTHSVPTLVDIWKDADVVGLSETSSSGDLAVWSNE
jgi:hypothetical protein